MALKEEARAIIADLEGKLKWFEESYNKVAAHAVERERSVENLIALLQDSQRDVERAREELGNKRLGCIRAENDLKKVIKNVMRQAVVDTLDRVRLRVEAEREVERQAMREEAMYLASDAFGFVRTDCF